jgi:uncharacterized flavoprotein (TIGR03862 family)
MSQSSAPDRLRPFVAVAGGGPAGLMAAEVLAQAGARVTVFDRMPSLARKFLMAGRGGLNLTHSEPFAAFLTRYGAQAEALRPALEAFTPQDLRAWSAALGEETFVGTSGRVFPKSFKASPLLRAWLRRLEGLGVTVRLRCALRALEPGALVIETAQGAQERVPCDAIVLALGGASWPRLGADGGWAKTLAEKGISIIPFAPANSGALIGWSAPMLRFAGAPLKNVVLRVGEDLARGECVIAQTGLEGGAVYALSRSLRAQIDAQGRARLHIDLRPDVSEEALAQRIASARAGESLANVLRKACGLSPVAAALAREPGALVREPVAIARRVKDVALDAPAMAGLARAISSAGGIAFDEIGPDFQLAKLPGVFVAGEMLDWEAPTGGYLLQACFATGAAAGRGAARSLGLSIGC